MNIAITISNQAVVDYLEKNIDVNEDSEVEFEINRLLSFAVDIMSRAGVSKDMDFVKKETTTLLTSFNSNLDFAFNNLDKIISGMLDKNLNPDVDASMLHKMKTWFRDELRNVKDTVDIIIKNAKDVSTEKMSSIEDGLANLEKKLDPEIDTSYLGMLKNTIANVSGDIDELLDFKRTDSFSSKLVKQLETYFGASSPILDTVSKILLEQQKNISEEIIKLREEIAKREGIAGVMEKTAIKGFDFEDEIETALSSYAKIYSDITTRTSKEETGSRSKKGDFIYELSEGNRIVIEAKDESVGLKPMLAYMKEAIENRECEFGILVTRHFDQLPNQVGEFNLYEGNKLFCSFDMLHFAIRWSRLYLTKIKSETVEGIDKTAILSALEKVKNQMKNFSAVKTKLTSMKKAVSNGSEEITSTIEQMKAEIENALVEIEEEIQ